MPCKAVIADWATSALAISTKPKPLERPVSRSIMTLAEDTPPNSEKLLSKIESVTE
jgi:hypothetical protein